MDIGQAIKERRSLLGISQQDLADFSVASCVVFVVKVVSFFTSEIVQKLENFANYSSSTARYFPATSSSGRNSAILSSVVTR